MSTSYNSTTPKVTDYGYIEQWSTDFTPENNGKKGSYIIYQNVGDSSRIYGSNSPNIRSNPYDNPQITNNPNEIPQSNYYEDSLSYLNIYLPNYGMQDFINERAIWQKGSHNMMGEPGWFYFKIFFHFNDSKLFGGIINNDNTIPVTSAMRYLYGIRNVYKIENITDRALALIRFTKTLSYINCVCPWFFKSITNVNKLNSMIMNEFTKEKSISIGCDTEAVDMRLNTLLEMYRYACFDEINKKEIIPENLRKFDMSILIMNVPIKYFQTAMTSSASSLYNMFNPLQYGASGVDIIDENMNRISKGLNTISTFLGDADTSSFNYKNISVENPDMMSFQLFTLKNCEIQVNESLENYYQNNINNSEFFNTGNNTIKITYDNVYKHTYNEWQKIFFGTTGIEADALEGLSDIVKRDRSILTDSFLTEYKRKNRAVVNSEIFKLHSKRIDAIKNNTYNIFFNANNDNVYKSLVDFSENTIKDSMIGLNNKYYLGNIGDSNLITPRTAKRDTENMINYFKWGKKYSQNVTRY